MDYGPVDDFFLAIVSGDAFIVQVPVYPLADEELDGLWCGIKSCVDQAALSHAPWRRAFNSRAANSMGSDVW